MSSKARASQSAATSKVTKSPTKISKGPLTHFLCIPLGHHAALRDTWSHISSELLAVTPPIPGLHKSILVPPRSLHLTLGVLSLVPEKADAEGGPSSPVASSHLAQHSVADALRVLRSLSEPIDALLRVNPDASAPLTIPLERLDVMNADPARAHVLWTGPDVETDVGARLLRACELVNTTFREAGMLQDSRELKLHCTLVNTVYRRPRGKRVPFSCTELRMSAPYNLIAAAERTEEEKRPWHINLGTWIADEVQLCEMGRTPDGTYRSVGAITLG